MELTYQSPLMPASYTALSADEMTYIDGGAIQIGSYLIEFHPEALLQSVVNFTVNFGQLMGKAALISYAAGQARFLQQGAQLHDEGHLAGGEVLPNDDGGDQRDGNKHSRLNIPGRRQAKNGFQHNWNAAQHNGYP